jgi:alpha/beta superfamily hydrolase
MNAGTTSVAIAGPVGRIDTALDAAGPAPRGIAVIAHPHPLYGGTRDNKVVQTLARALHAEGYSCWRPNFRGVGDSDGKHDEGNGETDDLLAVVEHARRVDGEALPLVLAGFSFGAFVQTRVAARLETLGRPAGRLVLVGVAVTRFAAAAIPAESLVIHGERDDVVPLAAVLDWARALDLPVVVVPGADHFFHRRLTLIKRLVRQSIAGAPPGAGRSPPDVDPDDDATP